MDEKEVLIINSKVRNYIKESSGLKVSADVAEVLSGKIRSLCDEAVIMAGKEKRKTLKGRDFE